MYYQYDKKTAAKTKGVSEKELPPLMTEQYLIDSTGVGDPITEDLQRDGLDVTGFKFSQTSKQQLMEGLQAAIHQRKISFPDGVIVSELEIFEYTFTATGVRYSAPSGFHDDVVCALALACQHLKQYSQKGRYSFA